MNELLPADDLDARRFNAAIMELGAIVCTARRPDCSVCPIRDACAWKKAGFPETHGPKKVVQKKFTGSDRQVRGLVLALLRRSDDKEGVVLEQVRELWTDATQLDRAVAGLERDGLVESTAAGIALPRS